MRGEVSSLTLPAPAPPAAQEFRANDPPARNECPPSLGEQLSSRPILLSIPSQAAPPGQQAYMYPNHDSLLDENVRPATPEQGKTLQPSCIFPPEGKLTCNMMFAGGVRWMIGCEGALVRLSRPGNTEPRWRCLTFKPRCSLPRKRKDTLDQRYRASSRWATVSDRGSRRWQRNSLTSL